MVIEHCSLGTPCFVPQVIGFLFCNGNLPNESHQQYLPLALPTVLFHIQKTDCALQYCSCLDLTQTSSETALEGLNHPARQNQGWPDLTLAIILLQAGGYMRQSFLPTNTSATECASIISKPCEISNQPVYLVNRKKTSLLIRVTATLTKLSQ